MLTKISHTRPQSPRMLQWRNLCHSPKCLLTDATVLLLARLYTRRLLSQYPPLNRNLASCDTTNKWLLSGRLGWKGPDSFLLVLQSNRDINTYHVELYFKMMYCLSLCVADEMWVLFLKTKQLKHAAGDGTVSTTTRTSEKFIFFSKVQTNKMQHFLSLFVSTEWPKKMYTLFDMRNITL
jgi:hypothetical protein